MKGNEQERFGLCPLHHPEFCGGSVDRRDFLKGVAVASVAGAALATLEPLAAAEAEQTSPPPKRPPVLKVGYLRHPQAVCGGWPGHGFNNDAACKEYSQKLEAMGRQLGVEVDTSAAEVPVNDEASIDRFIAAVGDQKPDAMLICPMGIFTPWQKAEKVLAAAKLPTLIFTQIGTSFTMNTSPLASKPGFYLVSSTGIDDVRPGLEMVKTAKTLQQSTLLVLGRNSYQGTAFEGDVFGKVGTKLKFVPGEDYVSVYEKTPITEEVRRLARDAVKQAKHVKEVTEEDIVHAARHYFAGKRLLAEHGADGLTSNCLGLAGRVGTPCLGFSRLMDEGITAACESDIGSAMTMMLIHNLLGRPGYMADPLVDTAQNLFANAHCNCPTRLDGFDGPRAEYIIRNHHHGGRHAALQVLWRVGQMFTLSRFQRPEMLIVDRARVVCNYDSPPSAACITNTGAIVEGAEEDPHKVGGFHVLQIYGDHVRKLRSYCQLYGIEAVHCWDPRVSFDFEPNCA